MVDFSKLRDATNAPREIDYLAYLVDEIDALTEWERNFCKSCVGHLRTKFQWLTQKQRAVLDKLIEKHKIKTEHAEYCVRGYADRTDVEVMNNVGPGTAKSGKDKAADQGDDTYEDDIPF